MRVVAVPVKPLHRAKRRLSPVLDTDGRARVTIAMLEDVLDAATAQPGWAAVVISPDDAVRAIASARGARSLADAGRGLGAAIRHVEAVIDAERDDLAIVLADLPWITARALAEALEGRDPVSAVASHSDAGTNVLVRRPGSVIPARFGRSSFARHRGEAHRRGLTFKEVRSPALAFDLDRPADVATLLSADLVGGGRTREACLAMGVGDRLDAHAGR